MARKLVKKELPVGIEAAAHSFAAMCKRDGVDGMVDLIVSGGTPDYVNVGGEVYMFQDGDWFVHGEVVA